MILEILAGESMNLNHIASHFTISRPAISKHIKILTDCGLIEIRAEGREHICQARLKPLQEVADWTQQYSQFWDQRLNRLTDLLTADQPKSKKGRKR
jgi:DNA-binding transcriptional ArsR family regulator